MKKAVHPFGKRLAELRKSKKMTQTELGKLMGVSRGMIAYYESSATNPTVEVIEKASQVLNVEMRVLIDNKTEHVKPTPKTKLQQLCEQLSELPRNKQKVVIDMLEGFLEKTTS